MQAAAERRGMGRKCLVFLILASLTCSLGDIGHMDSNNRSPPPNLLSLTRGMESCPISRSEASPGGGGHGADIAAAVGEALRLRGGGFVRQKRWYDDDIPEPKKLPGTSGITCLRYYLSPTGRRIYTLKKLDPTGLPTFPGHPPKFDPNDNFSRQRVTLKMRHGVIEEGKMVQEMKDNLIKMGCHPELLGRAGQNLTRAEINEIQDRSWARVVEMRKQRAEAARLSGTGVRDDGTVTMLPREAARVLGTNASIGMEDGDGVVCSTDEEESGSDPAREGQEPIYLAEEVQCQLERDGWFDIHPSALK